MLNSKEEIFSYTNLIESYYGERLDMTLDKIQRLNIASRDLEVNPGMSTQPIMLALLEIAQKVMPFLKSNNIIWTDGYTKQFWIVFNMFKVLKSQTFLEWGRFEYFFNVFPQKFFQEILEVGSDLPTNVESFTFGLKFYSALISFYENAFFTKVLVYKPRISTDQIHLCDPFFRNLVRTLNFNDPDIQKVFFTSHFSVKLLVLKCLDMFFHLIGWNFLSEERIAHCKTLRMVLTLFEYGLWTIEEMDELLVRIQLCSDRLMSFENLITDTELSGEHGSFMGRMVIQSRILIGKIVQHIIAFHFDYEVTISYKRLNVGVEKVGFNPSVFMTSVNINPSKVFDFERFKKKRLHTYFSYILLSYLLRPSEQFQNAENRKLCEKLSVVTSSLLAYISDLKNDFFMNSLRILTPVNCSFYVLNIENSYMQKAGHFFVRIENLGKTLIENLSGDYRDSGNKFFVNFEELLSEMLSELTASRNIDEFVCTQMAFSSKRIAHILLSILGLISTNESFNKKRVGDLIENTFEWISISCKDNLQCVNTFFSFYIFKHFLNLQKTRPLHGAFLMLQLLGDKKSGQVFNSHKKIQNLVFLNLSNCLEKSIKMNLQDTLKADQGFEVIVETVLYCKILKNVVRENANFDFKIDTRIAEILVDKIQPILEIFQQIEMGDFIKIDEEFRTLNSLKNLLQMGKKKAGVVESNKDLKYFFMINLLHVLALFCNSTSQFFSTPVYDKMTAFFEKKDSSITSFFGLIHSNLGTKTLRKILRIYSTFRVFCENGFLHNSFETNLFVYYFISTKKATQIGMDFVNFYDLLKEKLAGEACLPEEFQKLLLKGYLPGMFRFVSGLLVSYSDEKFKKAPIGFHQSLLDLMLKLEQIAKNIFVKCEKRMTKIKPTFKARKWLLLIDNFLKEVQENNQQRIAKNTLTGKLDDLKRTNFEILANITKIYKLRPEAFPKISTYYKFSSEELKNGIEERMALTLSSHMKFRVEYGLQNATKECSFNYQQIEDMRSDPKCPPLLKLTHVNSKHYFSLVGVLKGDSTYDPAYRCLDEAQANHRNTENAIFYYCQRYMRLKFQMLDQVKSNQIFRIFKLKDSLYQNIEAFIEYFASEIDKIPTWTQENSSKDFFLDQKYSTLLILTDNLIRVSQNYREGFFNFFKKEKNGKIFEKIWNLRQTLFDLVSYRTFFNDSWSTLFTAYYLVSCLIQNFCENNYVQFKNLICKKSQAENSKTWLKEYHESIERLILDSEIHFKSKTAMDVKDKEEVSPVYCRALEELNEFITGGRIEAFEIYRCRIDIWTGILFRAEGDIESEFYKVKLNVVLMINSFVESRNKEIIEFLANKIFVRDVFGECVRILTLLFEKNNFDDNKKIQKKLIFKNLDFERLLFLYKTNNRGFADHAVINLLVALYGFINTLSEHDLRSSHFVTNIEDCAKVNVSLGKFNHSDDFSPDDIACWGFLKQIVVEIELVVKEKDESGNIRNDLVSYTFKKQPICFFDSDNLRYKFLDAAPVENLEKKHEEFFNYIEFGIAELKGAQTDFVKSRHLSTFTSHFAFRFYLVILYVIALVLNMTCLIFFNKNTMDFQSVEYGNGTTLIVSLTILDAFCASCIMALWVIFRYPTEVLRKRIELKQVLGKNTKISVWRAFNCFVLQGMCFNTYWLNLSAHIILSLLGFASPIFYCFMLFLIIEFFSILKGVCSAIFKNLSRLFWTLVIIVIVVNFFALLITEYINGTLTDDTKTGCDNYFNCFINSLNYGVIQDGGVSSFVHHDGDISSNSYSGIFFINLTAFILINLFLLGMFFGIIVDAFSEYVKDLTERAEDQKSVCFTCGLNKNVLERNGIEFIEHVKQHSIFNYLYYVIYLQDLDVNSYSGVDYQVDRILKSKNKSEFLPKFQTKKLEEKGVVLRDDEKNTSI